MSYSEIVYPYIEGDIKNPPIIDVKEIKSFLKLPLDADEYLDIELSDMAETALEYAEKYCRQIFMERDITTSRVFWGEFRNGVVNTAFTLRRTPVKAIKSIKYDDNNELDNSFYKLVHRAGSFDQIALQNVEKLPSVKNDWFPIEITYTAGYDKLPSDIRRAMLMHIASMWLNRGDYDNNNLKCPQMSRDIYKKYKIIEIGT